MKYKSIKNNEKWFCIQSAMIDLEEDKIWYKEKMVIVK